MKKLFVLISALSIICIAANFSHSADYWAKTYEASPYSADDNIIYSVQQTTDGGYIGAGYSQVDSGDAMVIKLNDIGNISWKKTYGEHFCYVNHTNYISQESAKSIQQTIDGGYIVVGRKKCNSTPNRDYIWVLKLDSSGDVLWQKAYDWSDEDSAKFIQQTSDGGYIVAGITGVTYNGSADVCLMKLDSVGNVSWQKTYGGSDSDSVESVEQTIDGGYIMAAWTWSFGAGQDDIWVLKLDNAGSISWQKTYGGSGQDFGYNIQQTTDGGYIVAGGTHSFGAGAGDLWVLELDNQGNINWQKTYGGTARDTANYIESIQQTIDGGYIVASQSLSFGSGSWDIWILKLNTNGNISWERIYEGNDYDNVSSIKQTTDEGYIVVGYTKSFGAVGNDALVLKLDGDGEIPDCDIISTTNAIVTNTFVSGEDSSASVQSIPPKSTFTDDIPQNSLSKLTIICCYDTDDLDGDGVVNACDNCPADYNPNQDDNELDGIGDICDPDDDNDGIFDVDDNCPNSRNSDQDDTDGDGMGDVCDICPDDPDNDIDGDTICGDDDNCPNDYNPLQEDTYPPQGNKIGDFCECEADFNCDSKVDEGDVATFLEHFGRNSFNNPCTNNNPCNGDFGCERDVDGGDVAKFLEDFGRGQHFRPCPVCTQGAWCEYEDGFTDNGDGTVTDNDTELIWLKDAVCDDINDWGNGLGWHSAMAAAAGLNHGECGLSDGSSEGSWRLPTMEEWEEFVCTQYHGPALCNTAGTGQWSEDDPFTWNASAWSYWSSTEFIPGLPGAYWMLINNGQIQCCDLGEYGSRFVWPVRGGH